MKRIILLVCLAAALCGGCASTRSTTSTTAAASARSGEGRLKEVQPRSKQLEQSAAMLAAGDSDGAARILNAIVGAPSAPGVTDEALFRLALLSLSPGLDKPAAAQGQQLLKRLGKDYPKSPWTALAGPVSELINVAEELKRQNKSLKGTNQSLTKEVGELNRNIDRLKRLDLELEKSAH